MIDKIKDYIFSNMNKTLTFKINGNRNQIEEFEGKIISVYNAIFLVEGINKSVKSFTYTDILIGNLEINT